MTTTYYEVDFNFSAFFAHTSTRFLLLFCLLNHSLPYPEHFFSSSYVLSLNFVFSKFCAVVTLCLFTILLQKRDLIPSFCFLFFKGKNQLSFMADESLETFLVSPGKLLVWFLFIRVSFVLLLSFLSMYTILFFLTVSNHLLSIEECLARRQLFRFILCFSQDLTTSILAVHHASSLQENLWVCMGHF